MGLTAMQNDYNHGTLPLDNLRSHMRTHVKKTP